MPSAVRGPLKSSGLFLFAPNILIVGNPRILNLPASDLCSSAFTPATLATPCKKIVDIHIYYK